MSALCEKRSFFQSLFSPVRTEYKKIQTRKISVFGHFLHSAGGTCLEIQTRGIKFSFSNNVANICSYWLKVLRSTETKYIFIFLSTSDILCKLPTILHINSETNPPSLLINVVCKYQGQFLAQASESLHCQYAATLSKGEGTDLFLHSQLLENSQKFFQEATWGHYSMIKCCNT